MEKKSKWRKVWKIIGIVVLSLIILLLLAVGVVFVIDKVKDGQDWDELNKAGYINQISVGTHNLNVCIKGNSESPYTVVSLAGLNSMANVIEMEPMTDKLKDRYQFAFADRSGYGLSDDTHEEQTVEQVVTDYRTALQNSGLKAPYILMAHSFGGVYASYWQQTYPDEIKAVIYLDPTQIGAIENLAEDIDNRHADIGMYMNVICSKLGLDRLIFDSTEYTIDLATQQQIDYANRIWHRCPMSWTVCSEENNYSANVRKVADMLSPNDIPKLYIDAQAYTVEDIREKIGYSQKIADKAGRDSAEIVLMAESVDERLANKMKKFFEKNIQTYIDKLGNVTYINIPGDHSIFKHKPDETAKAVGEFLDSLS